jgi:hypothetical protein
MSELIRSLFAPGIVLNKLLVSGGIWTGGRARGSRIYAKKVQKVQKVPGEGLGSRLVGLAQALLDIQRI